MRTIILAVAMFMLGGTFGALAVAMMSVSSTARCVRCGARAGDPHLGWCSNFPVMPRYWTGADEEELVNSMITHDCVGGSAVFCCAYHEGMADGIDVAKRNAAQPD